ncbi:MAG: FAD-dependent oxidoreductase, partial [Candidatus Dormibacteraeota bacterium]|nr:FAD-dependent oxidoreductase [Candidatus Dormibacteraeota bacterium]
EEPGLGPRVRGAQLDVIGHVNPLRLVRALARTAIKHGASIEEGMPVSALALRGGRLQGVLGPEGLVHADAVVLAAGPWSASLAAPAGVALDVRPSRGQLVVLEPQRAVLKRTLLWQGSYLVPKPDGSVMAGSTEEDSGFDARPTAEGVHLILDFAVRAVPGLATAAVTRTAAALRPATPDGRPIIGSAAGLPGLVLACGHNRKGVLLAPITAELVAQRLASAAS